MTPTLTSLELEVLEVMASVALEDGPERRFLDSTIAARGRKLFGPQWTGAKYGASYPKINAALGRLARKGLVQRQNGLTISSCHWGQWSLSNLAITLVGLNAPSI